MKVSVTRSPGLDHEVDDHLVEAFLTASRVLVAVAVRSLAAENAEITLPQYRTLVVLASRGAQRIADLAELLGVNSSNATRNCDRLQRRGLVQRHRDTDDRRAVRVSLTPTGGHLVQQITIARRAEIARILGAMPDDTRGPLLAALHAFADAAGEVPETSWSLGWRTDLDTSAAAAPTRQGPRP